ncbi:hypothetical protein POM88_018670 [Heracleum sosnowskyi]|uniref:Uncharacterized protein n=1 Tax=Heracleum sosnowskyi TaxID=360622 RepID=A0AAD8IUA5_9APIA|nr:hypothetical protein POM88_018670 [Heracleum sosnowskyi]
MSHDTFLVFWLRGVVGPEKNGHFYGSFNGSKCNFLLFTSPEEAEKALNQFRGSSDCFVQPISTVEYESKSYLAVESFESLKINQDPSDERNNCLKKILKLAINLDLINQFNDGFDKLVMVSGRPKLCTLCDRTVGAKQQACELSKVMKKIVKVNCKDDKFRTDFLQKLDAAYTITDLRNCFYHPLLMTHAERIFFHPKCMLLIQISYGRIDHKVKLNYVWDRPDPSARANRSVSTWNALVKHSKFSGLKAMFEVKNLLGLKVVYGISNYEWHRFVRNTFQHVNDNAVANSESVPYDNLYEMMAELEHLFPELLSAMHSYMIHTDLYCEFERQGTSDNTIMTLIHAKMESLTRDLEEKIIPFAEFLQMIDMFDFILAKISVHCMDSRFMEDIRKGIRGDKKKVEVIGGNTLDDVTSKINNKRASNALRNLQRYLIFFNECVCQLENSNNLPLQNVVHIAIRTKCKNAKIAKAFSTKLSSCGLPDRDVVNKILQLRYLTTKQRSDFNLRASKLGAQLRIE